MNYCPDTQTHRTDCSTCTTKVVVIVVVVTLSAVFSTAQCLFDCCLRKKASGFDGLCSIYELKAKMGFASKRFSALTV